MAHRVRIKTSQIRMARIQRRDRIRNPEKLPTGRGKKRHRGIILKTEI
jgi:hypothetical protein